MIFINFLKNITIIFGFVFNLLKILKNKSLKKKNLKNFVLFIVFYLFLNLYLLPTYAFCAIDYDLVDRENNTYKGSKILYEDPHGDFIINQAEVDAVRKVLRVIQIISITTTVVSFAICVYQYFS